MMTVPVKLQLQIYNFVALKFATFSNNKNRGTNFSWSNFPSMMAAQAVSIMKLSVLFNSKYEDQIKQIASNFAEQLVLEAAYLSPDPKDIEIERLKNSINSCLDWANGREYEWGERAINAFSFLREALNIPQ